MDKVKEAKRALKLARMEKKSVRRQLRLQNKSLRREQKKAVRLAKKEQTTASRYSRLLKEWPEEGKPLETKPFPAARPRRKKGDSQKPPWHRRISLRGAVLVTTAVCVVAGFLACLWESYVMSTVYMDIYETYIRPNIDTKTGVIILTPDTEEFFNGEYGGEDNSYYIEMEMPRSALVPEGGLRFLYENQGLLIFLLCLSTALVAFLAEAFWLYHWKLKKPLRILNDASGKIAENDLDFTVEVPSLDELGRLCASFEQMRSSLEENNRKLWRSVEERRRLNAAFAHDLRTPLTVLSGYGDYLLEGLPEGEIPAEKELETIATMKRSISRLQSYVEGMNSVQKLEDLEPEPRPVSSRELCGELRESAAMLCRERSLVFQEAEADVTCRLDRELVHQVFENLMSNALRYSETRISVACTAGEGRFFLTVSDDGPGFSPEALKRASDPYYRADRQEDAKHFGLGLYICKVLCEKQGGSLTLANAPGGGARITAAFGG